LLLLLILQKANDALERKTIARPESYPLDGLAPCQGRVRGDPCVNLLFAPDTPQTRQIMQAFSTKNQERTGLAMNVEGSALPVDSRLDRSYGILPAPNADYIYNFALNHPNATAFGVEFTIEQGPPANYRYQVWYNNTLSGNGTDLFGHQTLALVRGVDEAIFSSQGLSPTAASAAVFDVQLKDWPTVPPLVVADGVVNQFGCLFFFCTQMIIFMTVLHTIVQERESRQRERMEVMGLRPEIYWTSWIISNTFLALICALVTSVIGLACRFHAFSQTNFAVILITFFLFAMAMICFAFFISTFLHRANGAILVGIFVFIVGMLFVSFIFSSTYVGYLWWDSATAPSARIVFMFLPFFNFGKMYLDISVLTSGKLDVLSSTYTGGPGFHWSDLYRNIDNSFLPVYGDDGEYRYPDLPVPAQAWYFLLMNIGLYFLLAMYFDRVIATESGRRESYLFFLNPRYWGWGKKGGQVPLATWLSSVKPGSIPDEDEDVRREREMAIDPSSPVAVRVVGLRKEYSHRNFIGMRKVDKVAVDRTTLGLKEGELLALLGQNGAGKSTTMNMLSGEYPVTSGDAYFYGRSLRESRADIRRMLGVCPQDDILFGDLNAEEHVTLYAGLKGLPAQGIPELVEDRLKAVKLWNVRKRPTSTYSGGMKRRLSVIISTIGDPPIVFLDEPTTGMDPMNRRYVWKFLERFKQGRVVILTTHSMEEADILGDRIAIMALGRLRALGNSVHLKNRFGSGYRLTLVAPSAQAVPELQDRMRTQLPHAHLEDESAGSLIYQVPTSDLDQVPSCLRWVEAGGDGLVKNWAISQATLEEVFLRLIRETNPS
ncbi:hypothetical protein BJ684DRAFT_5473, partial [Piptocephalis cylindrospora]